MGSLKEWERETTGGAARWDHWTFQTDRHTEGREQGGGRGEKVKPQSEGTEMKDMAENVCI